ncbi:MAG: TrkA family potassium uptake protein [Fimbriimonadaceae bacterium]|nr:TrkA family potassium uptake protein [Fimbriimonadaceae bacterium]QYK53927.1 MAG: TrkA family potassium uptake protein [Fimbriimonadaceae bacterium]
MKVVILGCGRSGASLAVQLSSLGHTVTVIERSPESLRRLGKSYPCRIVLGNGLDLDTLERADVANCDAFFAMTRGDNTNLMAAQIVKRNFKVERVAVKVADPLRSEAYRRLGLFTINAAALISGMCRDWLLNAEFQPVDTYNVNAMEIEV